MTRAPQRFPARARGKTIPLTGSAAVYYLYKKHQLEYGYGPTGRYYQSRSGRIYYRDTRGRAHWIFPPLAPLPASSDDIDSMPEIRTYSGFNGLYSGNTFGPYGQ